MRLLAALALTAALLPLSAHAQSDIVLDGLDYPWDIAPTETGMMLSEKPGFIVEMAADCSTTRHPVVTNVPIDTGRGRGLLGLAPQPDGTVYAYHSTRDGDGMWNRVVTLRKDGEVWRETGEIVARIPGHPLYNGGRIAFGPDGKLYITTGWIERPDLPQDLESLAGKILRLNPNGSVPDDNPFPNSPVWSMGHRNPQGIAWNAEGTLFAAEHGGGGHDEINRIVAGGNYGWPELQGDETAEGSAPPDLHSGRRTWAPSGIAFEGDTLLVAALQSQSLLSWVPGADAIDIAADTGVRMRDVAVVNGAVYAITTERSPRGDGPSDDRLVRIAR